ncbi:MAG: hypothetical protein PHW62_01565 [Candidatus Ratteibacteria bacterium]|nr:hypothetical protein [Candidatus Ratteibacteria bacterium]
MVLENLTAPIGTALTNDVSYWLLAIIISFFVFLAMKTIDMPRTYAGISSLVITIFLLEFILKALFGAFHVPLSFGTYTIDIPLYKKIIITDGVMIMRFLDFCFNFGLVRLVGLPYYETFMASSGFVPTAVPVHNLFNLIVSAISSPFNFFVFLYTSIDSIFEYVFFYFFFLAAIIFITDLAGANTQRWEPMAFLLAAVPVLAYTFFVSNPVQEYGMAMPEMQRFFYFLNHADTFSLVMFVGTLLISFFLVMQILAAAFSIFYSIGETTVRPDWISHHWEMNVQGVGFLYTLGFAIMYAMHQYSWYVFFPAMIFYSLFKKFSSGAVDVVKEHNDRQEMADYVSILVNKSNPNAPVQKGDSEGTSILFWIVLIFLLGVIVFGLMKLKWIPSIL